MVKDIYSKYEKVQELLYNEESSEKRQDYFIELKKLLEKLIIIDTLDFSVRFSRLNINTEMENPNREEMIQDAEFIIKNGKDLEDISNAYSWLINIHSNIDNDYEKAITVAKKKLNDTKTFSDNKHERLKEKAIVEYEIGVLYEDNNQDSKALYYWLNSYNHYQALSDRNLRAGVDSLNELSPISEKK